MVPVEDDGETVLMLRQFRAATGGDLLEIPAGKRDVDGELPEETAVREMEEELARKPGRLVKLCEFFNSPGFCDEYTHLFLALDLAELAAPVAVNAEEREMTVERVAATRRRSTHRDTRDHRRQEHRGAPACTPLSRGGVRRAPVTASNGSKPDRLSQLLAEHEMWLTVERGLSANTLGAYRRDLRRYATFVRRRKVADPAGVGESMVLEYVEQLKAATDDEGRHATRRRPSPARWSRCARFIVSASTKGSSRSIRARRSVPHACRRASQRR